MRVTCVDDDLKGGSRGFVTGVQWPWETGLKGQRVEMEDVVGGV